MNEKVKLNYREGDIFPWRIEKNEGAHECIQRGGESLCYEHEDDAISAIREFDLELVLVTGPALNRSYHSQEYFKNITKRK